VKLFVSDLKQRPTPFPTVAGKLNDPVGLTVRTVRKVVNRSGWSVNTLILTAECGHYSDIETIECHRLSFHKKKGHQWELNSGWGQMAQIVVAKGLLTLQGIVAEATRQGLLQITVSALHSDFKCQLLTRKMVPCIRFQRKAPAVRVG
jgi:hypothetical protein